MNLILTLAFNDVKLFLRDKSGYVWLFVMPVVFVYFFGIAFKAPNPEVQVRIWVHNQDTGPLGKCLLTEMEAQGLSLMSWQEKKESDSCLRKIEIPADFTTKINAGEQVSVEYTKDPKGKSEAHFLVEIRLFRAIVALTSTLIELAEKPPESDTTYQQFRQKQENTVSVKIDYAGEGAKIPGGFQQTLPGTLVLFLLINLLIYGGTGLAEERQSGVFRRMAIYPLSKFQFVAGKILGRMFLAVVMILYFLALSPVFGVSLGNDYLALAGVLFMYSWACSALSVVIGTLVTNPEKIIGLGVLIGNTMGALGGCWWPMEIVPETLQKIGHLFPTAWAMDALHKIINFGGSWQKITSEMLVLMAFGTLFTIIATRYLRYQNQS
ncbi:MAG: ABC transporter permease [Planctomycetota bacterium]